MYDGTPENVQRKLILFDEFQKICHIYDKIRKLFWPLTHK